jgi:biotin carboxyl carrier protein
MNEFVISINDKKSFIKVSDKEIIFNGEEKYSYELIKLGSNSYIFKMDNKVYGLTAEGFNSETVKVQLNDKHFEVTVRTALQEKAKKLLEKSNSAKNHHKDIKAPMPGLILKVHKDIGEKVEQGESIMILEAMKMENDLKSPVSGTIEKVFIKEGSAVEKGMILFSIC